jgi:MYXO-CTERM domain-containing protein
MFAVTRRAPHALPGFALAALAALAVGCATRPGLEARGRAVINGVNDDGHPTVGLLYSQGWPCCTATLIGPRTVLTAAHCVTDSKASPFVLREPIEYELAGGLRVVTSVVVHPGYSGTSITNDLAVVHLLEAVTKVTPTAIAGTAPTVGENITLVGFGCLSEGEPATFGTKRTGDAVIAAVLDTQYRFPVGATLISLCEGDSGGPSFVTAGAGLVQVGIHSYNTILSSFDQRVDAYHAWITDQIALDNKPDSPLPDTRPPDPDLGPDLRAAHDTTSASGEPAPVPGSGCAAAPGPTPAASSLLLLLGLLAIVAAARARR